MGRRLLIALSLSALLFTTAALAAGGRVVLVQPPDAPPVVVEALKRLEAELQIAGFESVVVVADEEVTVESLRERAEEERAFAAISLVHGAGNTRADLWISDRTTGKTVMRSLKPPDESEAARVLSIRAVELLRVSLRDERPAADVLDVATADEIPEAEIDEFAPPEYDSADDRPGRVGASIAVLMGMPAFEPAVGPEFQVAHMWAPGWRTGLALTLPLTNTEMSASLGTAEIDQLLVRLDVSYAFRLAEPLRFGPVLSLGAYHLSARGDPNPPLLGAQGSATALAVGGGFDFVIRLSKVLALGTSAGAYVLAPRPVVDVAGETGATGRPLMRASLGLLADF